MNVSAHVRDVNKYFSNNAPGVYLEDEFNLPRRSSFSTGVPVFIGSVKTTRKEWRQFPRMLSLWSQFSVHVGEFYQDCTLAYAVRGFF